jgi:hypothetical protein
VKFSIVFLILFSSASVVAKDFYIDPNSGSDNGLGTAESPWKSLTSVLNGGKVSSESYSTPYKSPEPLIQKNINGVVKSGDRILLASGNYGDVLIDAYVNSDFITIEALPGHDVRLGKLKVRASRKWSIKGVKISPEYGGLYKVWDSIVTIEDHEYKGPSRDIILEGNQIFSATNSDNWSKRQWTLASRSGVLVNSNYITLKYNFLKNIKHAVVVKRNNNKIIGNKIIDFSGDGMRSTGNDNLFQGNYVLSPHKVDTNHDDHFQSWSIGPDGKVGEGTVYRNILRNNVFITVVNEDQKYKSTAHGVGAFDGMYEDWVVVNNVVVVNHWHGISFSGLKNSKIINNTIVDIWPDSKGPAEIKVLPHKNGTPSTGNIVANNLVYRAKNEGGVLENNLSVDLSDFVSWQAKDFRLKKHSKAIDSANSKFSDPYDIEWKKRDSKPDIGAYEYEEGVSSAESASIKETVGIAKKIELLTKATLEEEKIVTELEGISDQKSRMATFIKKRFSDTTLSRE